MATTRTTAILAATTVLLVIYVVAIERGGSGDRNFNAIPVADASEITALTISGPGTAIHLERFDPTPNHDDPEQDLWRMTRPVADRADSERVNELVAELIELKKLESIDEGAPSDQEMGLDGDALRITIATPDGELGTIAFGANAGVVEAIYARWEDDAPFACWQDARDLAAVSHDMLRDVRLLAIPVEQMRRLKIKDETEASLVVDRKTENSPWLVTKPLTTLADAASVEKRLGLVANMGAKSFIDNPDGEVAAAFAAGSVTVSVWRHGARGATEIRLARSADGGAGFAKVSDREATFAIDPAIIDDMHLDPNALRARRLLSFNPKSVVGVQIEAKPNHSVNLLNDPASGWQLIGGGEKAPANRSRVVRLLKDLGSEEVAEFVADAANPQDLVKWGLDLPTLTITLSLLRQDPEQPENEDGSPRLITTPVTVRVKGQLAQNQNVVQYFATVEGSGTVVRLSSAFPSIVPIRALEYRSLYLWPTFNLASLRAIRTSRPPQASLDLEYLFETNTWTGTLAGEDVTAKIDETQALTLAQELSLPLRAARWITKGIPEAELRLQQPVRRIEFTLRDPADPAGQTHDFGLDVAPVNESGRAAMYYARVIGQPQICLLDRAAFLLLDTPLIEETPDAPSPPAR